MTREYDTHARTDFGHQNPAVARLRAIETAQLIRLYMEGLPYAVIAERMGLRQKTVADRCRRLRQAGKLPALAPGAKR